MKLQNKHKISRKTLSIQTPFAMNKPFVNVMVLDAQKKNGLSNDNDNGTILVIIF